MKLRNKLLFPLVGIFFISFSVFIVYLIFDRLSKEAENLETEMEMFTDLVATTNVSYVWNFDTEGLDASLGSFITSEQIVSIEIKDESGNVIAQAEDAEKPPVLFTREKPIMYDGRNLATAVVTFTDHYSRQQVYSIVRQILVLGLAIFLLLIAVLSLVAGAVTLPIRRLLAVIKDVGEGEGDLTVVIPVKSNDEIGGLSGYFNTFLGKLRNIVLDLKNVSLRSTELGRNLVRKNDEVSSAVEEISSTMRSMSDRSGYLTKEIENSSETVAAVNGRIEKVASMIEDQAASVNESSASVEEMIASVAKIEQSTEMKREFARELSALAKKSEENMARTVGAIGEISQSTEVIAEMIGMINSVASQTNLLAMNAAIEAAHAGESGKGFSVVADEIRKLAEQTATNAKNISSSLQQIVSLIRSASEVTKESSASISAIISGIGDVTSGMDETLDGLKEISIGNRQVTEALSVLVNLTEEVRTSGKEMRNDTDSISASFKNILQIAEENNRGVEESMRAMEEIGEVIVFLSELSKENERNIETLDRELLKFKT